MFIERINILLPVWGSCVHLLTMFISSIFLQSDSIACEEEGSVIGEFYGILYKGYTMDEHFTLYFENSLGIQPLPNLNIGAR